MNISVSSIRAPIRRHLSLSTLCRHESQPCPFIILVATAVHSSLYIPSRNTLCSLSPTAHSKPYRCPRPIVSLTPSVTSQSNGGTIMASRILGSNYIFSLFFREPFSDASHVPITSSKPDIQGQAAAVLRERRFSGCKSEINACFRFPCDFVTVLLIEPSSISPLILGLNVEPSRDRGRKVRKRTR